MGHGQKNGGGAVGAWAGTDWGTGQQTAGTEIDQVPIWRDWSVGRWDCEFPPSPHFHEGFRGEMRGVCVQGMAGTETHNDCPTDRSPSSDAVNPDPLCCQHGSVQSCNVRCQGACLVVQPSSTPPHHLTTQSTKHAVLEGGSRPPVGHSLVSPYLFFFPAGRGVGYIAHW